MFGPKALKAIVAAIGAGVAVISAQLDAGAVVGIAIFLKAAAAAAVAWQAVYWVPNIDNG